MITERDKKILKWIEEYKSITIDQCSKLFFSGNKMAYDQSRKRLRYLNKEGHIKRDREDPKSEAVYYMNKKLRKHDLKTMDMIAALKESYNITELLLQEKLVTNDHKSYIIDGFVAINYRVPIFIETDYTHFTSDEKIKGIINYLEYKHNDVYLFLIIKQTVDEAIVSNIGRRSKLVTIPWDFNKTSHIPHSLSLVIEEIESINPKH